MTTLKISNFENGTKIEDRVNTMLGSCPNFGGNLCKKKDKKREEKHWKEALKLHLFPVHLFLLPSSDQRFLLFLPGIFVESILCSDPEKKKSIPDSKSQLFSQNFWQARFSHPLPQKTICSFCCPFITLTGVDSTLSPTGILALLGEYILWFDCSKQISEIPDTSE